MSFRRTRAMARKEFQHILRDPRSLIMALAVPLMMLVLFGFALTLDVDRIPALVYDADKSPQSRALIQEFIGSRFFEIQGYTNGYAPIEREIDRGNILIGIAIPVGFASDVIGREKTEVQILLDGSDSNTAAIALGYAESVVQTHAQTYSGWQPHIDTRLRVWYNSELESKNYVVPGLTAVILMIIAALLTSLTVAREWEMGTMEQLLSTPLRPAELVLGKMLAYFALGITDALIAIGVGVFVFQVPLRGSVPLLLFATCVFLVGALFWGILLSAIARSQLVAFQMGILTSFLPAFLLSGFIYAIENMPPVMQAITYVVPARYFVTILKGIFLKGVGWEVLWPSILLLMAYGIAVFLLATRKVGQKVA
ncbi:MAG: ABC transporter permease [Bryobacteraceae bacterium]